MRARHNHTVDSLIISADDYGYAPGYDRGILEAAATGAIDAVSVMVGRGGGDPWALAGTGVEVGLHLELARLPFREGLAGEAGCRAATATLGSQLEGFERAFGRPPAFLDGHHHCHATPGLAAVVACAAAERRIAVRSVDERHRNLLRSVGVATPDLLVGRTDEAEPALPAEIKDLLLGDEAPGGVVEWMTHPGHPDPRAGSAYDAGRARDLSLLTELRGQAALRRLRATHAVALA